MLKLAIAEYLHLLKIFLSARPVPESIISTLRVRKHVAERFFSRFDCGDEERVSNRLQSSPMFVSDGKHCSTKLSTSSFDKFAGRMSSSSQTLWNQ
jgi:hypothetical protein